MKTATFALAVVVYLVALAVPAEADQIENLVFTGRATCLDSLCSSFGNGPVTGAYTLDVTMQSIVGAWSFSTPFGMISSADPGAYTQVDVPFSIPGVERENVYFETNTNTLGGYQFVALFFPNTDLSQTGPVDSNNSGLCTPEPTSTACDPDYALAGSVAIPEPSSLLLLGIGVLGLVGMRPYKKRLA